MKLILYYCIGFAAALGIWYFGAPLSVPADWTSFFFVGLAVVGAVLAWRSRGTDRWVMGLIALICLVRGLFFPLTTVVSVSMQPSFYEGDYVLFYRPARAAHGDVVLVDSGRGKMLIKRVIAMGGDRIAIKDGVIYVNGAELSEPYPVRTDLSAEMTEITIPAGKVFLMGDNRPQSRDSRELGVFDERQIKGVYLWHMPSGQRQQ